MSRFIVDGSKGYCWYTVGYGREPVTTDRWLKLGPVACSWYRWIDGRWRFELVVLNTVWHRRFGGPLL